jgi:hypothetical protein
MLGGDFQVLHCTGGGTTFLLSYGGTIACGKGAATGLPDCRLIVNNGTAGPSFGTCLSYITVMDRGTQESSHARSWDI